MSARYLTSSPPCMSANSNLPSAHKVGRLDLSVNRPGLFGVNQVLADLCGRLLNDFLGEEPSCVLHCCDRVVKSITPANALKVVIFQVAKQVATAWTGLLSEL